ncbi:hypothetical protein [Bacillus cereus group sp. BfR-BA-01329]|uniref:hypothetical protein n=1 Tax=Bacillus cereus group sp. BfR-BA-01329 TaxID=2920305 RepID=UPI001F571C7E|nr:hypothetical protein [Bacillus cereus group sp. BfR-BA-01329]
MKYKKILFVVPMVTMLGTPIIISPITASAAETITNNTAQINTIKGYLLKNGVATPIYENTKLLNSNQVGPVSPEFPTLSADPLVGVPKEGTTITESGNMGDVLYFDNNMSSDEFVGNSEKGHLPNGKVGKKYFQKTWEGIISGFYDPDTFELYPMINITNAQKEVPNSVFQKIIDIFDGQTKIKRETKYELIDSAITDRSVKYQYSKAIASGLTTTDVFGFSATLGWKVSAKIGGGIIPAEVTTEMSGSLTTNYNHTITITSSETRTQQFSVDKVDNPSYQYDKYAVAAYQLRSTYTIIPGSNLQKFLNDSGYKLANKVYKYSEDQLYFGVTPGSHL